MPSIGQSAGHKTKHDNRYINDDTDYKQLCQEILDHFDDTYEAVRLKNMDIYGVRGTRTIRNKKYEIKKSLEKYKNTGYCSRSLKSFIALTYNIEEDDMMREEDMENYEEYEESYNDITKHYSFDNVVFCGTIVNDIVGKIVGTSCNQDDYTKLYSDVKHMEKQMSKANIRMCRANNRLEKYSQFVELEMGEFIKYRDRDGTYRSGEKITNSFRKGGKSHIKLRVMGKIEKHIEIDRMIL